MESRCLTRTAQERGVTIARSQMCHFLKAGKRRWRRAHLGNERGFRLRLKTARVIAVYTCAKPPAQSLSTCAPVPVL